MDFDTPILSLPEAKRYFQAMGCASFHMAREYPERYDEYRALGISKATETEWASEDILSKFRELENSEGTVKPLWAAHSSLADLVLAWRFDHYLERLLKATLTIEDRLGQFDRLLMAETIVGRQRLNYRSGLIFRSQDFGRVDLARGFSDAARRFVDAQFTMTKKQAWNGELLQSGVPQSVIARMPDLDQRRQQLLEKLTETESLCGIHSD